MRGTPPRPMTRAPGGGTAVVGGPSWPPSPRSASSSCPRPDRTSGPCVAEVSDASALPMGLSSAATISFLSAGAPSGSIVLASAPAQVGDSAPIAPTVISGLAANGIPNVALNAYRVAAARMASAEPSCGIDWSLLAGIGRVESNHGRFRGATLNSDGTSSPRIMGPPLNGVQFAFIRDTDGGSWDGDSSYDRAVGPMQFIPATWRAYGIDADGTGIGRPLQHQRRGPRRGQLPLPRPAATCAPTPDSAGPSWPTTTPTAT